MKEIFSLLPSQIELFLHGHRMYSFHTFFPFVVLVLADMICHANVKTLHSNINNLQHAWNTICFKHTQTSPCVLQSIKIFLFYFIVLFILVVIYLSALVFLIVFFYKLSISVIFSAILFIFISKHSTSSRYEFCNF